MSVSVPSTAVGIGAEMDSLRGDCCAAAVAALGGEGGGGFAYSPVLWIMEPSLRERMKVDWTPGREVRCERRAVTCWGIWVC